MKRRIGYRVFIGFLMISLFFSISIRTTAQEYRVTTLWGQTRELEGEASFNNPVALAKDAEGNIYIADMGNHRIIKMSANGDILGKYGSFGRNQGEFDTPFGVTVDHEGNILVADTANYRVQKFDANFQFIRQWGSKGSGPGEFELAREIAIDYLNRYHVCDEFNNRIQVFDSDGNFLYSYGQKGAAAGEFRLPQGIAIGGEGENQKVYVCDTYNNRIEIFDLQGRYLEQIGTGEQGDHTNAFFHPRGINVDVNGDLYIADTYNHKIKVYTANLEHKFSTSIQLSSLQPVFPCQVLPIGNGKYYISDTGNSQLLYCDGTQILNGVGKLRTDGMYSGIAGVATDSRGNVFVTDSMNHRVIKYDAQGNILDKWGGNQGNGSPSAYGAMYWQFTAPKQISYDAAYNRILIADTGNSRIQVFNASGQWISNFGYGVFMLPMGVCTDQWGNIFISDTGNHRVMKCNAYGITMKVWGGFGTEDGKFNMPAYIACDSEGNVYVVDRGNSRVQKFTNNGVFLGKWGTNDGQSSLDPLENEGKENGDLFLPIGIAIDDQDMVYVTDSSNNRVQVFTNEGEYLSQFGYFSGADDAFFSPQGIAVDGEKVYVVDALLNRLSVFTKE